MRILSIFFAVFIALLGIRFLVLGLQTAISIFKTPKIPPKTKRHLVKDLTMGFLLLILAAAMIS